MSKKPHTQKPNIRVVKRDELVVPETLIDPALRPDEDVLAQLTLNPVKFSADGERKGGNPKRIKLNLRRIIMSDPRLRDTYRYNIFTGMVMEGENKKTAKPIKKISYTDLQLWIAEVYGMEYGYDSIKDLVEWYAQTHRSYNPIKDYFEGLEWNPKKDKPRLHTLLHTYFGCAKSDLNSILGMRWLLGIVARGLLAEDDTEGIKIDHIMILCGPQSMNKGQALKALASPKFFADSELNFGHKDFYQSIHSGIMIWEIPELHNLFVKGDNKTKALLSSSVDRWRPTHAKGNIQRVAPRRGIMVGTSNDTEILTDPTGSRRYWTVTVKEKCDFEAIKRDRDKLFAEAVYLLTKQKEQTWLTDEEEVKLRDSQIDYTLSDSWDEGVLAALVLPVHRDGVSLAEILKGELKCDINSRPQWGVGLPIEKHHSGYIRRVAGICQKLGAIKFRKKDGKVRTTLWKLPAVGQPEE